MIDFFDPNKLEDTAAASLRKDLGQQAQLEGELVELRERLKRLPENAAPLQRAALQLEIGRALQILERGDEAWPMAFTAFGILVAEQAWQDAADACDILYQADQPDSLIALGHGVWLGVTFPIDPEISVHLLSHVVDDTPDDSDGAAVAAATAAFLADVRAEEGPEQDRLSFFAQQLLGRVARRHSEVETQEQFALWVARLELNDPDKFLVRLRNVVDVLVQDQWWFDRDALQALIPAG
ncbi:MAG: hypothetical protein KDJ39_15590 [Gammaproteobacteria bacterium]|nr:hypothetical protein [Gammaproteobacteria bacterium]MCP5298555.1 hypothetical protein [Chromatiaceae bacterium]